MADRIDVAAYLRAQIRAGAWRRGEQLPPAALLAEQYGVDEAAASEAMLVLWRERMLDADGRVDVDIVRRVDPDADLAARAVAANRGTHDEVPAFRFDVEAFRRRNPAMDAALHRLERMNPAEAEQMARAAKDAADQEARDAIDGARRDVRWQSYVRSRPIEYELASFNQLDPQQDPEHRVTGWWASPAPTLLLAGPSQHGKTFAAYAVTNAVAETDRDAPAGTPPVTVRTWRAVDLYRFLGPLSAHERRDEKLSARRSSVEEEIRACDLLHVDDLGREPAGESWQQEEWRATLYAVLDHRTTTPGLRTIVSMNGVDRMQFVPSLVARFGEPIALRLALRGAVCAWVEGRRMTSGAKWEDPFA